MNVHVRISAAPLRVDELSERVRSPYAGAIVIFSGVTREVPSLEYEAYEPMAHRVLLRIAEDALRRHGLCAVAIEHRVGTVPLAEPSVIVAASAPHRGEAFTGARELIDRLKEIAPIWKREAGRWKHPGVAPGTLSDSAGAQQAVVPASSPLRAAANNDG